MRLWLQDSLEGTNVAKLHFYALRAFKKVSIDLAGISGYNGSKVIYLLGVLYISVKWTKGALWLWIYQWTIN